MFKPYESEYRKIKKMQRYSEFASLIFIAFGLISALKVYFYNMMSDLIFGLVAMILVVYFSSEGRYYQSITRKPRDE